MFTICNGMFIVERVIERSIMTATLKLIDGTRHTVYLPSLEPEDRERILREVETQIITISAAGPEPEVKPEAGGAAQSNLGSTGKQPNSGSKTVSPGYPVDLNAVLGQDGSTPLMGTNTQIDIVTGTRPCPASAAISNIKQEESMKHQGYQPTENVSAPPPQGGTGVIPIKRIRTSRPRDPEAEAIATITAAEYKRNERINKAKEVYDGKVAFAEDEFKVMMQDTLSNLDEVTRTRVGQWIELRYGKI